MNNTTIKTKRKPVNHKASESPDDNAEMVQEFFLSDCAGNILKAVSKMIGSQDVEALLRVEGAILELPGYGDENVPR